MNARSILVLVSVLIAGSALGQISGISAQRTCDIVVAGGVYFSVRDEEAGWKKLFIIDPQDGHREVLYEAPDTLIDNALSPRCDYVACTEAVGGKSSLILVNMKGEVTLRVPEVFRLSWSPDGKSIAYIQGIDIEGELGFRPASIWVYSIDDATARKLPCLGYYLAWAKHDGNLYVRDFGYGGAVTVYQYDPRDNQTKETSHRGIQFSPNGKYYYLPSYEGSLFELRLTVSDSDATGDMTCLGDRTILWPRGWLNDSILIRPSRTSGIFRDTLVNIETDTQCVLPGEVVTFPIEGNTFKMWHEGKIVDVALDSLVFTTAEVSSEK